jgi:hypothetical protein
MADNQTCLLELDDAGRLKQIHDMDATTEGAELIEWPIAPLRILSAGSWEYATEQIATDTADMGKLTSLDTLLEIALAVRGREGWEPLSVLPGSFGEKCYPPGVTVIWKRNRIYDTLQEAVNADRQQHGLSPQFVGAGNNVSTTRCPPWRAPIGPDPAGETA